ncbi:hypothetical protein DYBT9275_02997 [Dyadobacter sp. CECT 9275]|uniref:Uncharacterized protein n=1 Tax=Dyadobacter helix TaxID=2822344 RepID=A0A916JF96_9BACT|nr:hypothetical protein [Dyadobacter sp. CECT 9275]CAG5002915.1 hypothetical protein DYBT9275_02997 [Dyadobacter sp. CECT 9275]
MKNSILSFFIYAACVCFLNFRFSDDYSEFGITTRDVQERLWSGLQQNRLYVPYLPGAVKDACRAISPDQQTAAIQKLGGLVKSYYASEDFKKRYSNWLAKSFPQTETIVTEEKKAQIRESKIRSVQNVTPKSVEPVVDMQIQSGDTYKGMEAMIASMPVEQRADFKKQIDTGKQNAAFFRKIKPLLTSDFEEFKKQYAEHLAQEQITQEQERLVNNNKTNAEELEKWKNPKKILAAKLTEFLDKSKGVDFAAQTKEVNNRKKFVNAAYETKSDIWKFCYRMGKTPTATARTFAQQWLTELK